MMLATLRLSLHLGKIIPSPAPAAIMNAVQHVLISQGDAQDNAEQGFSITFATERSGGSSRDHALLEHPLLKPGNRVVISVTLNATPHVLMDGIINHQQLSPGQGTQPGSITVTGKDISVLMDLVDMNIGYPGLGDTGIALLILAKYAPFGIIPKVVPPLKKIIFSPLQRVPFQEGTDLAYLRQSAARNSYVFYIQPGPTPGRCHAYWGPPKKDLKQQKALTVDMGLATNVESLNFEYDSLNPVEVYGMVANPNVPVPVPVLGLKDIRRRRLAAKSPFIVNQPYIRKVRLGYKGTSVAEAYKMAQSAVNKSSEATVTANGTLNALKYGTVLRAPGIVGLRGVGYTYDGLYYVKQVSHDISRGEYKQSFTLAREGPGSTVIQVTP